jgi:DNA-binding transcriptional LysR family regulator
MGEIEVRQLRYFRVVAVELSFTRAAERLGMAQPPLSRSIRALERRLGVALFERTNRSVRLTAAGATLLAESGQVLDALAAAVERTRKAGRPGPLVVTAKPGVGIVLLRRIAERCADPVAIVVSGFGEQAAMVRGGRADVALVGCPEDTHGLDVEEVFREPRLAGLAADHPLAGRQMLYCRDLAGQPTPTWPGSSPREQAYWAGQDVTGRPVTPGPEVRDGAQLLETVALGQAVALLPASVAEQSPRVDIVYRPVSDATPYRLALGWPAGSRDRRIARLVRAAAALASAGSKSSATRAAV